jgi:di/tricarboxylate transporter
VLVFSVDVGLTAFVVALILQLAFRPAEREIIRDLPWSVVLVISGVLLYVGLLEELGTFHLIANHLKDINSPTISILALAFVGSLFASFESSSVAVLGIVIPVALQVTHGVTNTVLLLILCAVSWAIVTVSSSPYHLNGGLVLASSPEPAQLRLFRQLLAWSLGVAVVVPLIGWAIPLVGSG